MGLFLFSCKSHQKTINSSPYEYDCIDILDIKDPQILPIDEVFGDTLLNSRYSKRSLTIANAFGLVNEVRKYEALRKRAKKLGYPDSLKIELLTRENDFDDALDNGMIELISVGNRIDCAILNLEKVKTEVQKSNLKSQSSLTNAAVIVGGAASVFVAGILVAENNGIEPGRAIDWIGVAGGLAAVYLAARSTKVDKKVMVKPNRNVIEAIESGRASQGDFPTSTWYLLNQGYLIDSTDLTIRERILDTWHDSKSMLGSEKNMEYYPVLLQGEGIYTEEMLELRIDLLETVGVGIDAILRSIHEINSERR